ncbi:type IV secretion system protein [Neomoorella thermoacetica]|uniref:type IV secretion system protein n=1 Tax=Neomoorella thermoacetica TaxID=1525 RepID=UPI0009083DA4|nr:type IV secretion system protein [Moorella thermoacetica]APC09054.1 TrbL/VirB6 plasmid conjugal transfer protein [Moorella thermoacetica]
MYKLRVLAIFFLSLIAFTVLSINPAFAAGTTNSSPSLLDLTKPVDQLQQGQTNSSQSQQSTQDMINSLPDASNAGDFTQNGQQSTDQGVKKREPNFIERTLVGLISNVIAGLEDALGLNSIENLVFNVNPQNAMSMMPLDNGKLTGWAVTVQYFFSAIAMLVMVGYVYVLLSLLLRLGISAGNPGMRLSVQMEIATMFGSFILLIFFLPIIAMVLELAKSFTLIWKTQAVDMILHNDFSSLSQSTLSDVLVALGFFGVELYFNFIYGVIFLSTTFLIICAPIFIFALNFPSTRRAFETFVRELASNILTPVFHAIALNIFVYIIQGTTGLLGHLIFFMALIPLTDLLKTTLVGNTSSGSISTRLGGAATRSLIGGAMALRFANRSQEKLANEEGKYPTGETSPLYEDANMQAMVNRTRNIESEMKAENLTPKLPLTSLEQAKEQGKLWKGMGEVFLQRQLMTPGSPLRRGVGTALRTAGIAAGGIAGATAFAAFGPAGVSAGASLGVSAGSKATQLGDRYLSGHFNRNSPEYTARKWGIRDLSYDKGGNMTVEWDADTVRRNTGINEVYQDDNGDITYVFDTDKWSARHSNEIGQLYDQWNSTVVSQTDPDKRKEALKSFTEQYGVVNMARSNDGKRMEITYNRDFMQSKGIMYAYQKDKNTFVETYKPGVLPYIGKNVSKIPPNINDAPRYGIGR